ncbi:hypothetical protein [Empedobacter falsenii]|uniref:hypothetical protein n=1 Tax=Empedobacter falsenii TaxID=343874 RepID=UPI000570D492|nr:hypothetical protein [Empedobacter falsenii]
MNKFIIFVLGLILFGCNKEECVYDDYFMNNQTDDKPTVYIVSSNNSCNELYLKGNFYYKGKDYSVNDRISIQDSFYSYSSQNNNLIFDFSDKKRNGFLLLNDSTRLQVKFFMDIEFKNRKFRLFKIDNVENYYQLNLSSVLVVNYNNGIVGSFITGKENNQWMVTRYQGFIPNKDYFYSIFQKGELL